MENEFIKAVDSGNVKSVRLDLSNELLFDPRGKVFKEMLDYAVSKLPNLFEENKESNYTVPNQNEWDEEFLYKVKNDLDSNFSVEKIAFYQAVIEKVGKSKAEEIEKEEQVAKQHEPETTTVVTPEKKNAKTAAVTISTGGALLTIAGLCFGKTLLTLTGCVVLVGGVALIIKNSRDGNNIR